MKTTITRNVKEKETRKKYMLNNIYNFSFMFFAAFNLASGIYAGKTLWVVFNAIVLMIWIANVVLSHRSQYLNESSRAKLLHPLVYNHDSNK
jgi:hypothetical protein